MEEKINKFLKELFIYYGNDSNKTSDSIYYFLTKYNLSDEEKKFKVSSLFPEWISYFKNKPNINVFNSPSWKYFCQFVNAPQEETPLTDEIKIYLHVNSKDIFEVAKIMFEYLSLNNIHHNSKIGSDIRLDDIVIRVYSKKDYLRIKNFIERTPVINNSLQDSFPIGFHDGKINLALDRDMSFNQVVSTYLYWYIVDSKKAQKEPSYQSFYNYIINIYNQVFVTKNKKNIDLFLNRFANRYYSGVKEEQLNNYQEITKVLIESLREDTLENYFNVVDFCNDDTLVQERIDGYNDALNQVNISEKDILLVKECILVMYKKYGDSQTAINLNIFLNTGNLNRITRDNDLRRRFTQNMSPRKLKSILGNKTIEMLISETIKSVENLEETEKKHKLIFDYAIIATYKKYGLEQVLYAVNVAIKGNYDYFTNDDNARNNLISNVSKTEIKKFVNDDALNYINNTLQNYGIEMQSKSK